MEYFKTKTFEQLLADIRGNEALPTLDKASNTIFIHTSSSGRTFHFYLHLKSSSIAMINKELRRLSINVQRAKFSVSGRTRRRWVPRTLPPRWRAFVNKHRLKELEMLENVGTIGPHIEGLTPFRPLDSNSSIWAA